MQPISCPGDDAQALADPDDVFGPAGPAVPPPAPDLRPYPDPSDPDEVADAADARAILRHLPAGTRLPLTDPAGRTIVWTAGPTPEAVRAPSPSAATLAAARAFVDDLPDAAIDMIAAGHPGAMGAIAGAVDDFRRQIGAEAARRIETRPEVDAARARAVRAAARAGAESFTADLPQSGHHVYRLWSESGRLLYVGVSRRLRNRIRQHLTHQPWAPAIARVTFEDHGDDLAMLDAEARAIAAEAPAFNKAGV